MSLTVLNFSRRGVMRTGFRAAMGCSNVDTSSASSVSAVQPTSSAACFHLAPSCQQRHFQTFSAGSVNALCQKQQQLQQQARFLSAAAEKTSASDKSDDDPKATTKKPKKSKMWTAKEADLPRNQPTWYKCIERRRVRKEIDWINARLDRHECQVDRVHGLVGMVLYTRDKEVAERWGFSPEYPIKEEDEHVW